ncbi:MAG: LysR family transcriptional regulator [Verrucomicrobiota bacterium]
MELYQLKYLLAIAEHKSYGEAARFIRVSQPSLSIQVRRLEEELRCRLFNRTSKGVTLTPSGERVLQSTRRILSEIGDLRLDLESKNLTSSPSIRLGVQPMLASTILPEVMKSIIKKTDRPRISVIERSNALLPELLQKKEVHACLMTQPSGNLTPFKVDSWGSYGYALYGKNLKSFPTKGVRLESIIQQPLLLFRDPLELESILHTLAKKQNIFLSIPFSCEHALTLLEMATTGLGYAILPDLLLKKSKEVKLQSVPLLSPSLRGEIIMVQRKEEEEHPLLIKMKNGFQKE